MGIPALPCPSPPLFPSFLCVLLEKSQTQSIHQLSEGAVRLHCIAKLLTKRLTGSNVGLFFFLLGAQRIFQGARAGRASLRRPPSSSCLSPPLLYPYSPVWCRYRPKVFLFDPPRQAHLSKHRAPVGTSSVLPSPPLVYTQRPSRRFQSFPESS
jgi:hypothetical protein